MGLDQSLIAKINGKDKEIHCWRKHPNLHGFMEEIWRSQGNDESFNCVELVMTEEIINQTEKAIKNHSFPDTSGFFFGESDGSEASDDLEAMSKARQLIKEGTTVVYSSWW